MSGCPACEDELIVFELGGVEVDHCVGCRGTWLDGGELELIVELAGAASGELSRALAESRVGDKSKRRCPRCRRRLVAIRVGPEPEIELDRCAKGHGFWFDSGEMRQLIARRRADGDGVSTSDASGEGDDGRVVVRFFADLFHHELQASPQKGQES